MTLISLLIPPYDSTSLLISSHTIQVLLLNVLTKQSFNWCRSPFNNRSSAVLVMSQTSCDAYRPEVSGSTLDIQDSCGEISELSCFACSAGDVAV